MLRLALVSAAAAVAAIGAAAAGGSCLVEEEGGSCLDGLRREQELEEAAGASPAAVHLLQSRARKVGGGAEAQPPLPAAAAAGATQVGLKENESLQSLSGKANVSSNMSSNLSSKQAQMPPPSDLDRDWKPIPVPWFQSKFSEKACTYAYNSQTTCADDNINYLVLCCKPKGEPRQIGLAVQCCDTCRQGAGWYAGLLPWCGGNDPETHVFDAWCGQYADQNLVDIWYSPNGAGYGGMQWRCKPGATEDPYDQEPDDA